MVSLLSGCFNGCDEDESSSTINKYDPVVPAFDAQEYNEALQPIFLLKDGVVTPNE